MPIRIRQCTGPADLHSIIDLKRLCTTPQNIYDAPTVSDLRELLAPITQNPTATRLPWEDEHGKVIRHLYQRAMTQQATALWEETDGTLVAYALIAFPGTQLTFQVQPQARGGSIEKQILTWGMERIHATRAAHGQPLSLWCRCHEGETERRAFLEDALFKPLPARDLRMSCVLDEPLSAPQLPPGFILRRGITRKEFDQYQNLHLAVFDGISMGLDYHQSPSYQPDLDLISIDTDGTFVAFCLCELKQVVDSNGEYTVGEIGVIGTRPTHRQLGLGRILLLTAMQRLKEHGATSAFLATEQAESAALRLFKSVGFRTISTWQWFTHLINFDNLIGE